MPSISEMVLESESAAGYQTAPVGLKQLLQPADAGHSRHAAQGLSEAPEYDSELPIHAASSMPSTQDTLCPGLLVAHEIEHALP